MNRALWKAKRIDNGELVEGFYYYENLMNRLKPCIQIVKIENNKVVDSESVEIDPSTLCQIAPATISMREEAIPFENDLIEMLGEIYIVKLLIDQWILRPINNAEDAWLHLGSIGFDYKIIRNIHDKED